MAATAKQLAALAKGRAAMAKKRAAGTVKKKTVKKATAKKTVKKPIKSVAKKPIKRATNPVRPLDKFVIHVHTVKGVGFLKEVTKTGFKFDTELRNALLLPNIAIANDYAKAIFIAKPRGLKKIQPLKISDMGGKKNY